MFVCILKLKKQSKRKRWRLTKWVIMSNCTAPDHLRVCLYSEATILEETRRFDKEGDNVTLVNLRVCLYAGFFQIEETI